MAPPQPVEPVKLIVAILWNNESSREAARERLIAQWGTVDVEGADHPFDVTHYYQPEMGRGLKRRLLSFQKLVAPEAIVQAKLECNDIEDELAGERGRRVNLDIGYLDHGKLVLASLKFAGQKIHLGDGVYADLIGRYRAGRYQPFDWTFPDFRDGRYDLELNAIRERYLVQRRQIVSNVTPE